MKSSLVKKKLATQNILYVDFVDFCDFCQNIFFSHGIKKVKTIPTFTFFVYEIIGFTGIAITCHVSKLRLRLSSEERKVTRKRSS